MTPWEVNNFVDFLQKKEIEMLGQKGNLFAIIAIEEVFGYLYKELAGELNKADKDLEQSREEQSSKGAR